MGIFGKLFGEGESKGTQESALTWHQLKDLNQMSEIEKQSFEKPVIIFKHSTRCSISRMALKQFEGHYAIPEEEADAYFLDLLSYRNISDDISRRFGVMHQSPQIVVVKDGKCVFTASHGDINAEEIKDKIESLKG